MPATSSLETILGRVLGAGSAISTTLLGVGLLLSLAAPGAAAGATLMRAGLVILLATPMARVLVTTLAYLRARDWTGAAMTGAVLLVLTGSVIVALRP